ncbi:ABC transporter permease [Modestobacter versicolor]|uniref:ABC transporter permease n=1 Tax=Modestobacter versicolor TaxID=429133 RepID=A0A323VQC8_9ACTN|nr:ABC transporter permease [Modestobacter versicolor]MBB3678571.1 ABC-type transport system involved in multi-copper enzyme maturation permease subunit [Modestobacter versicolor]PZA21528.1 ABC transporter permease [Modestobacter versicolor]
MGAVIGRLVRAEWTKLLTTRVWIGLLLGSCVLVGGFATLFTAFAGNDDSGISPVGTADYEQLALAVSANATILFIVLGIIGTTQEYRHRTATPTFLASPHRGRVVIAKLVAYALAAIPMALVVIAVDVLVVSVYAGAKGAAPSLEGDNLRVLGGAWAALVIYTVIGVGVGALLRNQVGAIVGVLVYLFVVEGIISSIPATQGAYKWLPGGALEAMTATFNQTDLLSAWQGGLVLLGYGLLAAVLGTVLAVRRDVV